MRVTRGKSRVSDVSLDNRIAVDQNERNGCRP